MARSVVVMTVGAACGIALALAGAPTAGADPSLLPKCQVTGGSPVTGGTDTDCATEGDSQITATPNDIGAEDGFWGFPGFGFY